MIDQKKYTIRNKIIFKEAGDLLSRHSVSTEQNILLTGFLLGLKKKIGDSYLPFVNIPLTIHSAIRGVEDTAIKVAVASLFLYLAADIVDDIADGDFTKHWGEDVSRSEGILASVVFASSIAPLALDDIDIKTQTAYSIKATLSKCIITMAAGQQGDLQSSNSIYSTSPEQVIRNVQKKSGAEIAGFSLMAAQVAGADNFIANEYKTIGRLIGTAGQIVSDCHELYDVSEGRDLANGTVTLPLAIHCQRLIKDEKKRFSNLIKLAQHDESARIKVRHLVAESGSLSEAYAFLKKCKIEALARLDSLDPLEPAASELRSIIKRSCTLI